LSVSPLSFIDSMSFIMVVIEPRMRPLSVPDIESFFSIDIWPNAAEEAAMSTPAATARGERK
jgi:hypothetical protein